MADFSVYSKDNEHKLSTGNFIGGDYTLQPLPVGRSAAVYYRQSWGGQIGNIATTLHTVDMIEHLLWLGWVRENVFMMDMDTGVSGRKKSTSAGTL